MTFNATGTKTALHRSRLVLLLVTVVCLTLVGSWWSVAVPAGAQPGSPTTTLPPVEDDRGLGDIIPEPNSGRAPESPSDPGGWLQLSLFFLVMASIGGMVLYVWWQSRKARERRRAAGLDPLENAKRAND